MKYIHTALHLSPPSSARTFSSCKTETPSPLNTNSPVFLPRPAPGDTPPLYVLSLWTWLFWMSHANEIIYYLSFCGWPISLSISSRFIRGIASEFRNEFKFFFKVIYLFSNLYTHRGAGIHNPETKSRVFLQLSQADASWSLFSSPQIILQFCVE